MYGEMAWRLLLVLMLIDVPETSLRFWPAGACARLDAGAKANAITRTTAGQTAQNRIIFSSSPLQFRPLVPMGSDPLPLQHDTQALRRQLTAPATTRLEFQDCFARRGHPCCPYAPR